MNHLFEKFFIYHSKQRYKTHLLFWFVVYGLGVIATQKDSNLTISQNTVLHIAMMVSKIPIAYWVVYMVIPLFFDHKKYLKAILYFLIVYYLNFCLSTVFKIFSYPYFDMFVINEFNQFSLNLFFKNYLFSNLGATTSMVLIKILLNRSELQHKSLVFEKQKSEIELKLLKTQLNPHFLFNTLNNIYTLSLFNSPKTSDSIARLSDILDYILYRCNNPKVPVKDEIKLIENYIELEKLRYDERLSVIFNKQIEFDAQIAPLILITFIENAFKHGASQDIRTPRIKIDLTTDEKSIFFCIENSVSNLKLKSASFGIGLTNLKKQLELIYGNQFLLTINESGYIYKLVLKINVLK